MTSTQPSLQPADLAEVEHPWQSGPAELIAYAIEHLQRGTDFDRRIAFLLFDVGMETLFKVYLTLPDGVTGAKTPPYERQKASEGNFHELVDGVRGASGGRLDRGRSHYVQYYHGLRNKLYHQGDGVTVPVKQVQGYARLAVDLLKELLEVDLAALLEERKEDTGVPTDLVLAQPAPYTSASEPELPRDREQLQREFFTDLRMSMQQMMPTLTPVQRNVPSSFCSFRSAHPRALFGWDFVDAGYTFRNRLYIETGDTLRNKQIFDRLFKDKDRIEQMTGSPLQWERRSDLKASIIAQTIPFYLPAASQEEINRAKEWALKNLAAFVDAFDTTLEAIRREEDETHAAQSDHS